MKTVNKKDVDALAALVRKFAETGDVELLPIKHEIANKISIQAFGNNSRWLSLGGFFEAACGIYPLNNCTNEEIYKLLEALDIIVIEEGATKEIVNN